MRDEVLSFILSQTVSIGSRSRSGGTPIAIPTYIHLSCFYSFFFFFLLSEKLLYPFSPFTSGAAASFLIFSKFVSSWAAFLSAHCLGLPYGSCTLQSSADRTPKTSMIHVTWSYWRVTTEAQGTQPRHITRLEAHSLSRGQQRTNERHEE